MIRQNRGFNLLEVVVGAFIFSVAAIALIGIWGTHYRAIAKSRHRIVANFMAEKWLEDSIAKGHDGLSNGGVEILPPQHMITTLNGNSVDVVYDVTREVIRLGNFNVAPPARPDKLKKVIVTVTWQDSTGVNEVKLETVVGSAD